MNTLPHFAQKSNLHFVYELVDPRDNTIFYVGITIDLLERFKQHMRCDSSNVAKNQRLREILDAGHLPIMRTKEVVTGFERALVRETFWIRSYLQQGIQLLNIASVPVDPNAPQPKRMRYKREEFDTLYIRTYTGRIVNIYGATEEEFDEFIKRYFDVEESIKYPGWPDFQRRRAINYAVKNEVELDFCDPPQEGA